MHENKNQTLRFVMVTLTFETLSWRHDFGQMVYGILLMAFAGSALAFGNMGGDTEAPAHLGHDFCCGNDRIQLSS